MSMTDEVRSVTPYRKRAWVDTQLGDEAAEFAALLADPTVSPTNLWRVLDKRGIDIPSRTVHAWAREARR